MSKMFGKLKSDDLEESQDRLGGFAPFDTDAYLAKIKVAYAIESSGGATGISIIADIDGMEYKEICYVTNRKGENWYLNPNDKTKKVPLPGFTVVDDICLCLTEKPLAEQDTEEKVVNVWDPDQKKELPKSVPVLVDLLGGEVYLGIVRQTVNVNVKDAQGNYVPDPSGKTRDENFIDKVFHHPTHLTIVEVRNGQEQAKFFDSWCDRNKGKTRDRTNKGTAAQGGVAGKPGSPPTAGAGSAPRKSLFGGN